MADKRLTAARPDLAAAHLKGQVEAARFVEGETFSIGWGRAPLRVAPSDDAAQDSELLFGEIVTVYERKNGWAWLQAASDGYVGYVRADALGDVDSTPFRVNATMSPLFPAADLKAPVRDFLPMNARVPVLSRQGDYVEVKRGGYVYYRHLVPQDQHDVDFVAVAERFLGVPYVWGGKTFAGIDCSGLIQTSLTAAGIKCPRDTDLQERALGNEVSWPERGDLVFWKGHVGVMRNSTHLVHANAFHMQVAREPLAEALTRIEQACGRVTSVRRL